MDPWDIIFGSIVVVVTIFFLAWITIGVWRMRDPFDIDSWDDR